VEVRFIKQKIRDAITVTDKIELVNCDRDTGYSNGPYTVIAIEDDGSVTIAGTGELSGMFAVIHLE